MLLQTKNIKVHFATAEVIKGINVEVATKGVVSIIGSNGAGKSTFLKAITGSVSLHSGEIWFLRKNINALPVHEIIKLGIALVPEGRRPFPYMSVLANLKLGAYLQKDKRIINRALADIFDRFPILWKRRKQQAGTLSGGEQQMLVIGRALMSMPKIILMDEPSLGLAPIVIEELVSIIKDINRDEIGVLLVEQNANMVTQVSERGYVMEMGKIVLKGDIKKLMAHDVVQRAFLGT
ncbi:MAG: ABC transporter ATP-binding protein [Desulfobacterales bacterium]|jgi:branched-chain amino acid transport system ATP-binding protein|nr:ABC transporter ATP-binding protein [Desulfobacterales bacterium]MDP6808639.1 ABC transporter ATP-binding protein [Desulfobacterales bacterium]|tara:strand:+ start:26598 stop:27305 length:708 start_codon:yes stop_codon:yes gene_type:complete